MWLASGKTCAKIDLSSVIISPHKPPLNPIETLLGRLLFHVSTATAPICHPHKSYLPILEFHFISSASLIFLVQMKLI